MNDKNFMFQCDICNNKYQMGEHKYELKLIPRYQLSVCKTCYESNKDGWSQRYEDKIISNLRKNKLPIPKRNNKSLLPRD